MAMMRYEYTLAFLMMTIPLVINFGLKYPIVVYVSLGVSLIGLIARVFVLSSKKPLHIGEGKAWVKVENFDVLEKKLIKDMASHKEVISQIISSLKQFSKKQVFKNYLGFNFILGQENQGKKDVIFKLLEYCKSDVDVKVFYGGLCKENNVKSYFEDLINFINKSDNPVVIFVDIEKLPDIAFEILTDSLSRGVLDSKEDPVDLDRTLFFSLVDVDEQEYSEANENLEQVLKNKNIPNSLVSKNTLLTYIRSFEMSEIAEQILSELNKIWESEGIRLNKVAPKLIYQILVKMKESGNENIEFARNWILKNHHRYIERVKEKNATRIDLLMSPEGKMKIKLKGTKK